MKTTTLFRSITTFLFCNLLLLTAKAQFASGTGTSTDPYVIMTTNQFQQMTNYKGSCFILMSDLDFTGFSLNSIGSYGSGDNSPDRFHGVFDGNGHTIKNIVMNKPTDWDLSIFGVVDGATIKKIIVNNCQVTGSGRMGVLTGLTCRTTIDQVAVVNSSCIASGPHAGGITGPLVNSTITNCYTQSCTLKSGDSAGGISSAFEGGAASLIQNCYSTSTVETTYNSAGILGNSNNDNCSVIGCLAANSNVINNNPIPSNSLSARVANKSASGTTLNRNYALTSININGITVTSNNTISTQNGADVTTNDLTTDFYTNTLQFDMNSIWKLDQSISQYPVFQWQTQGGTTNVPVNKKDSYVIQKDNNNIIINGLTPLNTVSVYNISGTLVSQRIATKSIEILPLNGNGIFILKISSNTQTETVKLLK